MECSKIYVHLNDVFRRVHIYMFSLAQDDYIVCLCVIIMIHFLDSSTEVVACLNGEQGMVQFLQLHHINSLLEFEMSNCPIWSLTKASRMVGRAQRAWLLRFGEVGCLLVTCPFSMPILQKMNWPPLEYLPGSQSGTWGHQAMAAPSPDDFDLVQCGEDAQSLRPAQRLASCRETALDPGGWDADGCIGSPKEWGKNITCNYHVPPFEPDLT